MSKQVQTKLVVNTRKRNRATTFFRPILIIPILIFISTFTSSNSGAMSISFTLAVPVLLALVFRNIYPSYIYGFNQSFLELQNRISLYALYLTDDFPSIEKSKNVTITLPDVKGGKALNRWLPLVKWFLAIPLYIVGAAYLIVTIIYTIIDFDRVAQIRRDGTAGVNRMWDQFLPNDPEINLPIYTGRINPRTWRSGINR
jgi:hypothetical protein